MDVSAVAIIRNEGEGERLWFYGGGLHTWKATAEETDGAFLLFEDLMSEGKTTPLHAHANEDEACPGARTYRRYLSKELLLARRCGALSSDGPNC